MNLLTINFLETIYKKEKEASLSGKWIRFKNIKNLLNKYEDAFQIIELGTSEKGTPIYTLQIGTGEKNILLWSQMHGNESTGTKALFDLFNCFLNSKEEEEIITILERCTLLFIPMLNPDGAEAYTRVNGNNIDLNRDAVARKAKESNLYLVQKRIFHRQSIETSQRCGS